MLFYFSYLRSEDNSAVNPEEKTVHQVRGDLIYPIGIESGRIVSENGFWHECVFEFQLCVNNPRKCCLVKLKHGGPLCAKNSVLVCGGDLNIYVKLAIYWPSSLFNIAEEGLHKEKQCSIIN